MGVFLYGSQNYEMDIYTDDYMSDIDVKAFVFPSLDDIVAGRRMVNEVIELEDKSHIEVKDIRKLPELLEKANPAYLELLFTKFKVINPKYEDIFEEIFETREEIVHADFDRFVGACFGMFMEKKKALRHPYPTILHKIEKFGYDPKQLHHMFRLYNFIYEITEVGVTFEQALVPKYKEYLLKIKTGIAYKNEDIDALIVPLEEEFRAMRAKVKFTKHIKNEEVINFVRELIYDMIKTSVINKLMEGELY